MTIHTLHPYLNQDSSLYIYDDAPKGVFKEPLVHSTTEAIHSLLLSAGLWDDIDAKPERVTLKFTDDPECCLYMQFKQDPIVKLQYARRDADWSVYLVEGIFPPAFADERTFLDDMSGPTYVDLCDHLSDYFPREPAMLLGDCYPSPPEFFYCQLSLRPVGDLGLVAA